MINEGFTYHKIEQDEFLVFEDELDLNHPEHWEQINFLFHPYDRNAGVSSSVWWIKFSVNNQSPANTYYLYTDHAALEYVKLYQRSESGAMLVDSVGCKIPFHTRKVKINSIAFRLDLQPGLNTFYLKINSPIVKIPFSIVSEQEFEKTSNEQLIYYSWLNGILLFLCLIAFGTSIYIKKDFIYLKYFCYVFCMLISFNSYVGFGFRFLWPNALEWNSRSYLFLGVLMTALHLLFALDLLRIKKHYPRFYNITTGFAILLAVAGFLVLILDIYWGTILAQTFIFLSIPFSLSQIYLTLRKKSITGIYYTIGYILFILPMASASLKYLKFMPLTFQGNDNSIYLGMVLEIIFFSIALGYRTKENIIRIHSKSRIQAVTEPDRFINLDILTKKENMIFNLAGQQFSDSEIAEKSGTTIHTVRYHLKNIYEKLELKNRIMLLQKYKELQSEKKKIKKVLN